jgi:hypothetical protein
MRRDVSRKVRRSRGMTAAAVAGAAGADSAVQVAEVFPAYGPKYDMLGGC